MVGKIGLLKYHLSHLARYQSSQRVILAKVHFDLYTSEFEKSTSSELFTPVYFLKTIVQSIKDEIV